MHTFVYMKYLYYYVQNMEGLPRIVRSQDERFESSTENTGFSNIESPEFKEAIHTLETYYGLSDHARFITLATALHIKPAAEFSRQSGSTREEVEDMLSKLKLYFHCPPGEVRYIIGNSEENLSEAVASFGTPPASSTRFGAAMGYPDTSIEAFEQEDLRLPEHEYADLLTEEELHFSFITLSRAHYKEELAWIDKMITAAKENAPELYEEMMSIRVEGN